MFYPWTLTKKSTFRVKIELKKKGKKIKLEINKQWSEPASAVKIEKTERINCKGLPTLKSFAYLIWVN